VSSDATLSIVCQSVCQPVVELEFPAISAIDSKSTSFVFNMGRISNPTLSASSKALTTLEITLKSVCTRQGHANDSRVGLSHFIRHYIPVDIHRRPDVGVTH